MRALAIVGFLICTSAAAQNGGANSVGIEPKRGPQTTSNLGKDCAPIGKTEKGEMVFPLDCDLPKGVTYPAGGAEKQLGRK